MIQLESLASLGEIIGAFAVVVSLIYLAVQVRQSTQAQRTENFSRALDRQAAMQATLSQDPDTSIIYSMALAEPSKLTPKERTRLTWAMYELFGAFEFMFLAAKANAIPAEVRERWSLAVAWWLTFPGTQIWWEVKPTPFTDSFTSYIESLLENYPSDPDATSRYQQFIAQGKYRT